MPHSKNAKIRSLASEIAELSNDRGIRDLVDLRRDQFEERRKKSLEEEWFSELCFCLLTANSSARIGMEIQESMGSGCRTSSKGDLRKLLSDHGYRFPNVRAEYICEAREIDNLVSKIESFRNDRSARDWLVDNVKGLGYKEASHFLRNTGHFGVAILDRHILRVLFEHGLLSELPKALTQRRYLEIEEIIDRLSQQLEMPPGIVDLYLWYMKTGEILK